MIAQILYIILMTIGFGLMAGSISNGGYKKEYNAGSVFIGFLMVFGLYYWGGLFDQSLNVWAWVLVIWHFVSLGINIAKHGQVKYISQGALFLLINVALEIGLIVGSGFFDPLIK